MKPPPLLSCCFPQASYYFPSEMITWAAALEELHQRSYTPTVIFYSSSLCGFCTYYEAISTSTWLIPPFLYYCGEKNCGLFFIFPGKSPTLPIARRIDINAASLKGGGLSRSLGLCLQCCSPHSLLFGKVIVHPVQKSTGQVSARGRVYKGKWLHLLYLICTDFVSSSAGLKL